MSTSQFQDDSGERGGFRTVAYALRRAITGGDLRPSDRLPPIGDLARTYGTTAVTVRRALRSLEEEGLVQVVHGSGTFVADWSHHFDLLHLPSFSAAMGAPAPLSETEVRGRERVASPEAAAALGVPPRERLGMLARLRRVEGRPIVFQRSYVPPKLNAVLERYTPEQSLYALLQESTGRHPVAAEERIRPVILPGDAAAALDEPAGAPGLLAVRTTLDAAGQPLLYDEAYFSGSRVELQVRRRGPRALLHYAVIAPPEEE